MMMQRILADYPPNSELFRWLHDLVDMWDRDDNHYLFWFTGRGMPRREHKIPLSHRGRKKVEEMVGSAITSYKSRNLVDVGEMDEGLQDAIDVTKRRPHYSRLDIYEAMPFVEFFVDVLKTIGIYGLELTGAGKQAMARLMRAREDDRYATGNLYQVDELLEELDQLVIGKLLQVGEADSVKDTEAGSMPSEWLNFYPAVVPFSITLHLDVYVQPAHSKEEWAKANYKISDEELGYQRVEPSDTAIEPEGQCPSPSVVDTTTWPALTTDQSDKWSTWACCGDRGLQHESMDSQC